MADSDPASSITAVVSADASVLDQLERRSADLADHLLLALSAGRLGTWRWDMGTNVTVWDAQMERLFGLDPGSFGGTYEAWVAALHPDDVARSVAILEDAVANASAYDIEHRVIWPDGSLHWIEGRGKVILDGSGAVAGTIGCCTDVTDRKRAEAEAQRQIDEAEEAASNERLQRQRFEFLTTVNDVALTATDHADLIRHIAAAAVPRLGDWVVVHHQPAAGLAAVRHIAHADPARQRWAEEARTRFPYRPDARVGIAAAIRDARTQFIPYIDKAMVEQVIKSMVPNDTEEVLDIFAALDLTSVIAVPLITSRGVVGAIQFVSAESGRRYGETDVALAEAAAGRIAAALENAWLRDQHRAIAETLQAALLPAALPEIPHLDLSARYWAAGAVSEVGGDFYDVFPISDGRWALVIGDVCGTGATAAAVTATARHTIRAAATHGASPTEVLQWVNDAVLATDTSLFCTLLYAELQRDPAGRWIVTSVAGGHPSPLLVGVDGEVSMVGEHGTLIGVFPVIEVHTTETVLPPGSTLVLHTDGVNDVRPPHGMDDAELFAMVGAAARDGWSADDVVERLGAAIAAVLPIPEREDDVALVVLRAC